MTFARYASPILASILAAMLAATPVAAQQTVEPRVVVDEIAQAVADNYFDPARGDLVYRNGRRPAWRLQRLSADLFFDVDAPFRRVLFERYADRQVVSLEILDAQTGGGRRYRRGE